MPYHFKKEEPLTRAIRRMFCERLDAALESLRGKDRMKAVHDVRREIKKLRALLRLMRGEIGRKVYRRNNLALREAAERLTDMRDAQVRLNALERLARHFSRRLPERPFPKIKRALRENCRVVERAFVRAHSPGGVAKIFRELNRRANDLKIGSKGWEAVCPGLNAAFCRAQETFKTAQKKSSPENLHEWRKRVKVLWYHTRLLGSVWPQEARATADELESLGALLGDDHDLVMLAEFAAEHANGTGESDTLKELVSMRRKELRSKALKIGRRFFAEKPPDFCRRLGNYWKIWRSEG